MTQSHTPGPWGIAFDLDLPYIVADQIDGQEIKTVCEISVSAPDDFDFDESLSRATANARLIAAAPDMLDTLRKIETTLDSVFDGWIDSPIGEALYAARAAIAKATGA